MFPSDVTLILGMSGAWVSLVQTALAQLGFDINAEESRQWLYGDSTQAAVNFYQARRDLPATGMVDAETGNRLLGEGDPGLFVVYGWVKHSDGTPIAEVIVEAFDVSLTRPEKGIGSEGYTDAGGSYNLRYTVEDLAEREKTHADLRVRARRGETQQEAPLRYNAGRIERVDFVFDAPEFRGSSRRDVLQERVGTVVGGMPWRDLDADKLAYVAGKTQVDLPHVTALARSYKLAEDMNLPPEALYAWLSDSPDAPAENLLARSTDDLVASLERAVELNVIPTLPDTPENMATRIGQARVEQALKPGDGRPTLRDRFGEMLDEAHLRTLAEVSVEQPFLSEAWRNSLVERGFVDRDVERVGVTYVLGALTQDNLPLAQVVQTQYAIETMADLRTLSKLERTHWATLAADHGVPEESRHRFAGEIAHTIEQTYPTAVLAHSLDRGTLTVADEARPLLARFFAANPDYEFDTHGITPFLAKGGPANLDGMDETQIPILKSELLALDRVRKIVPRSADFELTATTDTLMREGYDSSYRIASGGLQGFIERMKPILPGGEAAAVKIFEQAESNARFGQVLLIEYTAEQLTPVAAVMPPVPQTTTPQPRSASATTQLPDLTTLFGNLNFCQCEHCRSVYSPAAYLVDILKFIEDRETATNSQVMKVLMGRRPDLGEIELTCANTNTPMPYVDLVNEVLEDAVAPSPAFAPLALDAASLALLDRRDVAALKNAHPNTLVANLAADAEIEVIRRGEVWAIDDAAFTYSVRAEKGIPEVMMRGRQTKGTGPERAAQPQYVNQDAYIKLNQAVFPWLLPFDFPLEQATTYLDHLGVSRAKVMETFLPGARRDLLNNYDIACAYLGLSSADAGIITGETVGQSNAKSSGPWNFWGFDAAQGSIPDPGDNTAQLQGNWLRLIQARVDVFQQQSTLSYRQLLDLLDTYFVNPITDGVRQIGLVSTDPKNPEICETDKIALQGFETNSPNSAVRVVRFVRLWRKLGWSMRDLDRAITAFKPPLGSTRAAAVPLNRSFLVQLAHVERLRRELRLPVARLLSLWSNLDTASYCEWKGARPENVASVYAQLFRNRLVLNPPDPDFVEDASQLQGKLSENYGTIAAALGLSVQDVTLLAKDARVLPPPGTPPVPVDALNLANLSQFHRHALLAKALRLPVSDYFLLLDLGGTQPFNTTADTVLFTEQVQQVRAAGLPIVELAYLLRHRPIAGIAADAEAETARALDGLRRNLKQLATELDALDPANDPQGNLTRQKLLLLNWDGALVEQIAATLNNAVIEEALLEPFPSGFMSGKRAVTLAVLPTSVQIPATLPVSYDAVTEKLEAARFLTEAELKQLRALDTTDNNYEAAVNALALLQAELQPLLQAGLSYDEVQVNGQARGRLRHAGVITPAGKQALEALTLPTGYSATSFIAAVNALFNAPRDFLRRALRRYSVQDYATDLDALPEKLVFPQALQHKIYYDALEGKAHFIGVMLPRERDVLLALSNDVDYQAAVGELYKAPALGVVDPADTFLNSTSSPGDDVDTLLALTTPAVGAKRYAFVLGKLLPSLRRILSERLVQQFASDVFGLELATAQGLLGRWLIHPDHRPKTVKIKEPLLYAFLDPVFVDSHPALQLTAAAFPAQFAAFTLLQKAGRVLTHFKMTPRQARWLGEYSPAAGWLDLNSLPLAANDPPAALDGWLRLSALGLLRDALPDGERVLDTIFTLSRDQKRLPQLLERLNALTSWQLSDLQELASAQGLNLDLAQPGSNSFHDERALARLAAAFALLKQLGMTATQCGALARDVSVTPAVANTVVRAVRAKYDEERWLEIAPPLRDALREKQRAALVAYLINRPDAARGQTWRDVGDIYAHFLIDVEMSPCFMTSRIKQAANTVQLYVQRCLLNLEKSVSPSVIDTAWWGWMKSNRVWEANRKVFVYPENWIEPDLRHDKSSFYVDLESQLQQADVTADNVEKAFLGYLENLERVARLEVVCAYEDVQDPTTGRSVLHVIARTFNTPPTYYYRRWIDGRRWTPWEPMALDVEGDHIVPIVWMQQLYLFWLKFSEIASESEAVSNAGKPANKYWKVEIAFSEYKDGKWTSKQLINVDMRIVGATVVTTKREEYMLGAIPRGNVLELWVGRPILTGPTWQWQQVTRRGRHGNFTRGRTPSHKERTPFFGIWAVDSTEFYGHQFIEIDPSPQRPLRILLAETDENSQLNRDISKMVTVLQRDVTAAYNQFKVAFAQRFETFSADNISNSIYARYVLQDPFFYQDTTRTYFAHYEEYAERPPLIALKTKGSLMKRQTTRFQVFYHPYVDTLRETLNTKGLDGLLSLSSQRYTDSGKIFLDNYAPTSFVDDRAYPQEDIDFHARGAYSQYNWELFFHAPFLIATRLSKNQRYEQAQKWFHTIFDPTTSSTDPVPARYWRVKPFYDAGKGSSVQALIKLLADKSDTSQDKWDLEAQVAEWRINPFMPHAIARWRPRAYQLAVVMKYLDNLIAWGDQLFRRDTIESINEATQIYILAAEILGKRPEKMPPRAAPRTHTYNSLAPLLDKFGNGEVAIEEFIQPSVPPPGGTGTPPLSPLKMLYFCVPNNDKLLTYWDVVEDRLFKIRHCMNMEGITRQLPLFDPPLDPAMLVQAAAAGVDLAGVLNDSNVAMPHYRFATLSAKASELCAEVKAMGAGLLAALEKRDGEAMARLRATHEFGILEATRAVKESQIAEAQAALDALAPSLKMAQTRLNYYMTLLSTVETIAVPQQRTQRPQMERLFTALVNVVATFDPRIQAAKALAQVAANVVPEIRQALAEFDKLVAGTGGDPGQDVEQISVPMNRLEKRQLDELKLSNQNQLRAMDYESLAQILALIPDITLGAQGAMASPVVQAQIGGTLLSTGTRLMASEFNSAANEHAYRANLHAILAGYQRRSAEWVHQCDLILTEMELLAKQTLTAAMRLAAAVQDQRVHEQQIQNARETDAFMRDKYTNQELYDWHAGQWATLHFQSYQLAFDECKRVERAFRRELGLEEGPNFIQFGYWDSLKKGLMAGEKLHHDLKRMEVAYLDQNRREYELTKHVSLAQLDPVALIQLKQTGECTVNLPEALYDLDKPADYMRRIKMVSLTIPCVTGPHTNVSCRLTLLKSSVRRKNTLLDGRQYARQEEDNRFIDLLGPVQSMVTSSAREDSGLFDPNLRDERYLFFEYAGAISQWRLELTAPLPQFDYSTISDVVFHVRYTAREGGDVLRGQAIKEMQADLAGLMKLAKEGSGLRRMFSVRHEFPNEWRRLIASPVVANRAVTLTVGRERFPYFAARSSLAVEKEIRVYAIDKDGALEVKTASCTTGQDTAGHWQVTLALDAPTTATDVFVICRYTV